MKKTPILLSFFLAISLISCKKQDSLAPFAVPGTISVDINGQRQSFTVYSRATKFPDTIINRLTIEAHERVGADFKGIVLNLYSSSPITNRQYLMEGAEYGTIEYQLNTYLTWLCPYRDINGGWHQEGNITISEINDAHVRGTFSGKVWNEFLWLSSTILSNGSFDISF